MKQMDCFMLILALLGGILMSGCTPANSTPSNPTNPPATQPNQTPAQATPNSGLANPASVNCVQKGNKLEIRTATDGSQTGYCIFPDGSECEEWAFLRGECSPGTPASTNAAPSQTAAASTDTPEAALPAGATLTPGQPPAIDPAVQKKVVGAAQTRLARKLNLKAVEISLVSIEPVSWPDSCLGLSGPDEMCAQVITDGYKVVLSVNGQNYTFHTDQTGQSIRQEP
jgi:putative hemolysin